jgi:hypothetical protein
LHTSRCSLCRASAGLKVSGCIGPLCDEPRDRCRRMEAAAGGSLCVRARRLPRDFPALLATLREPGAGVQLIVCLDRAAMPPFLSAPIEVPSLSMRAQDLPQIIEEYALLLGSVTSPRASDRGVERRVQPGRRARGHRELGQHRAGVGRPARSGNARAMVRCCRTKPLCRQRRFAPPACITSPGSEVVALTRRYAQGPPT